MHSEELRYEVIARLILNTKRQKRVSNLIEISKDIKWLAKELGSMQAVSEVVGISSEMLRRFLSVDKLSPKVKKLVNKRKIDSITLVNKMKSLNYEEQEVIADEVIKDRLHPSDIKVIIPFLKDNPDYEISQGIEHILKSKNIKVYILHFIVGSKKISKNDIVSSFRDILGIEDIISVGIKEGTGTLTLSKKGKDKIRATAKNMKMTLREYVDFKVKKLKGEINESF